MEGAVQRRENRMAEVWFTAMLPRFKKPPSLKEFISGGNDRRSDLVQCLSAWDKIDRALSRGR